MAYFDPILQVFGDDPEALKEFERIKALRGEVDTAKRLQRLGAVGALATDEGLRGFSDNLYRTGVGQEASRTQAMQEGYEGLKQTRSRAKERAEEQAWREQQRADEQAYRQQQLALQRAQEARMEAQASKGQWEKITDEYTGETSFLNLMTGERRDAQGTPVTGAGTPAAGSPAAGATPPRASMVKFKDRPGVETEREKVRNALEQVALLEQLYGSSGGTGFGRGVSLPTDTAQRYDATIAQLAPLLTGMARTPGEGSQSDIEFKAKLAGMPYRVNPGDVFGRPEANLEQNLAGLRGTLEGRMQLIGAQLGMTQEQIQQMIDEAREAAGRANNVQQEYLGLSPEDAKYLGR
jgi:hypothetical protein